MQKNFFAIGLVIVLLIGILIGRSSHIVNMSPKLNTHNKASGTLNHQSSNILPAQGDKDSYHFTTKSPMPTNSHRSVFDYLIFIEKVEQHRRMLIRDVPDCNNALCGQITDSILNEDTRPISNPMKSIIQETARGYNNWIYTLRYFDTCKPPYECKKLSEAYRSVLYTEIISIGNIYEAIKTANLNSPDSINACDQALRKMQSDPHDRLAIEEAERTANAEFDNLVYKYDLGARFKTGIAHIETTSDSK